jgi:hypothetical protein
LLSSGKVLFAGGIENDDDPGDEIPTTIAELYDIATGQVTTVADRLLPRSWHTATELADGSVLIVGGAGAEASVVRVSQIFDPIQEQFRLAASTNVPRSSHTANTLADGTILFTGGLSTGAQFLFSAERFSPPEPVELPAPAEVVPEPTEVPPTPAPVIPPVTSGATPPPSGGACSATGGHGIEVAHIVLMLAPLGLMMRRLIPRSR